MTREEAIQILQLYRDEIEQRLNKVDSPVVSVYQRQMKGFDMAIEALSAEAVQGEWVEEDEYGDLWVCDQCGFASEYKYNFCPSCGADMRGAK